MKELPTSSVDYQEWSGRDFCKETSLLGSSIFHYMIEIADISKLSNSHQN